MSGNRNAPSSSGFTVNLFDLLYRSPEKLEVLVEQFNLPPTPLQFRLLCNLTAEWSADFQPFSDPIYQSIAREEFGAIAS